MALDEHREAFSPTLWYLPKFGEAKASDIEAQKIVIEEKADEWDKLLQAAIDLKSSGKATDKEVNDAAIELNNVAKALNQASRELLRMEDDVNHQLHPRTLKQVWFPGYHIHIGGGSNSTLKKEGDMEEMSNITFSWMLDQIKPFLFLNEEYLYIERGDRDREISTIPEDPLENESWGSWLGRNAAATASAIRHPFTAAVKPVQKFRKYGWGTGNLEDSFTALYYLNGSLRRTPGNEVLDSNNQPLGDTCEFIHPVVGYRVKTKGYKPIGGAHYFRYQTTYKDANDHDKEKPCFEYEIGNARKPLREWQLGGPDSYERLAIAGEKAYEYVAELDEALGVKKTLGFCGGDVQQEGFTQGGFQHVPFSQGGFKQNGSQEQRVFQSTGFESKRFQMTSEVDLIEEMVTRG